MTNPTVLSIDGYPFVFVPLAQVRQGRNRGDGLYVIVCVASDDTFKVIGVGQMIDLDQHVNDPIRGGCWMPNCAGGELWIGFLWPDMTSVLVDLKSMEMQIRASTRPPC